jgi:hypothetical protein
VRLVQQSRKDADLNIADWIQLQIELEGAGAEVVQQAIASHAGYIREQTLTQSLSFGAAAVGALHTASETLGNASVRIHISKAASNG